LELHGHAVDRNRSSLYKNVKITNLWELPNIFATKQQTSAA
jgi:hypothetical protein